MYCVGEGVERRVVGVLGEPQGLLVMPEEVFLPLQGQARQKVSDILGGEHVTKPEEGKDLMDGSADLSAPILLFPS